MLCHIIIWSCNHFIELEKDIELYCKKYGNECKFISSSCDLNKHKYVIWLNLNIDEINEKLHHFDDMIFKEKKVMKNFLN